ncbi:MAG: transposase [Rubrobacteraceae bacterium]|nr:transposase [Rubrobacteraceae bacterium]
MGRHLVGLLKPWAKKGRAADIDFTVLFARGGVWHKKDKEAGVVPHSSIDTQAGWIYSGWHGWVYGWKLHLACTVGGVWIPLAARLAPANVHDVRVAPQLIEELPEDARFVLGDKHYDAEELKQRCLREGCFMVSPRRGRYLHTDDGVEVRRFFHLLRHRANGKIRTEHTYGFDPNPPSG